MGYEKLKQHGYETCGACTGELCQYCDPFYNGFIWKNKAFASPAFYPHAEDRGAKRKPRPKIYMNGKRKY